MGHDVHKANRITRTAVTQASSGDSWIPRIELWGRRRWRGKAGKWHTGTHGTGNPRGQVRHRNMKFNRAAESSSLQVKTDGISEWCLPTSSSLDPLVGYLWRRESRRTGKTNSKIRDVQVMSSGGARASEVTGRLSHNTSVHWTAGSVWFTALY